MLYSDSPDVSGASETTHTSTLVAAHADPNSPSTTTRTRKSASRRRPIVSTAANFNSATAGVNPADLESSITPRQLEVLALVASGYSYADIASMKFYSPSTVQNHVAAALRRSRARNTTNLVAMLVETKIIRRNSEGTYEPVQDLRIVEE
jgi:DNA-binding NarL/FixJ family response regulator